MKRICVRSVRVGLTLAIIGLLATLPVISAARERKATEDGKGPCFSCHDDLTTVLSSAHPAIRGADLQSCMECHTPGERGVAKPNSFAVRLHLLHLAEPVKADCLDCHSWEPGKAFGLTGTREVYGAPTKEELALIREIFMEQMTSSHLGARHAAEGIGCAGCHGRDVAGAGGLVENATCLGCHQPVEDLIVKTTPADFPDRNPHKSHLGEIGCTVCHVAHGESHVYCLECHPKFGMKIE